VHKRTNNFSNKPTKPNQITTYTTLRTNMSSQKLRAFEFQKLPSVITPTIVSYLGQSEICGFSLTNKSNAILAEHIHGRHGGAGIDLAGGKRRWEYP
jgi:hypothetical protein